ncbi:neuropeptide CCHamide-1 receptor-like, partial [Sitophilus oryzae]|uniref:Neuropeptide CCHamide-1 receptor-like n=1 Tax=Sitophilus oryzae TaxID=7048 RepID=A0A6J2XTC3_SITOR
GGRRATRITICTAVGIWVLAFICAIPALIGSHIKEIRDDDDVLRFEVCYPFPEEWLDYQYPKVMVMARFLVLYIIPLTIIFGFYLSMAISLITSTRNVPGELQGMHRQIRARKKVAVTVLVFVAVFAICFAPFHAFMLFFYFNDQSQELYSPFWHYFRIFGFCLCYINSCANPVALYFVSGAFRKHFNSLQFVENGALNTHLSIEDVLQEVVVPFAPFIGNQFILMHDNARPYTWRGVTS